MTTAAVPTPRLHPNLAEVYRRNVAGLIGALAADDAAPARELIRDLVEAIVLIPENGRIRVEVRGELAAILRLAAGQNARSPGLGPGLWVV